MDIPSCKKCKWYKCHVYHDDNNKSQYDVCTHKLSIKESVLDPLNGKVNHIYRNYATFRDAKIDNSCGPTGRYFSPLKSKDSIEISALIFCSLCQLVMDVAKSEYLDFQDYPLCIACANKEIKRAISNQAALVNQELSDPEYTEKEPFIRGML